VKRGWLLKIVFLARQLNIGGSERQLVILANELASRGHEVVIASYYPGGELSKQLDSRRVRLISLGKRSRWDLLSFYMTLVRVVRQERPAVLCGWMHTQNLFATMAWLFNRDAKLFWSVRSSKMKLNLVGRVEERLRRILSRIPACIVVNSLAGLEYAASIGVPRRKMVYIPNGIDTTVFYPDPELSRQVRAEWGISDSEKLIGYVARFDPLKNHTLFLNAAAGVAAERSEVSFVCIGHGNPDYLKALQELTRTLGIESKVRWVQAHPNVTAMYNALDVFCSSSLTEGFPNVIGEAMACARRCVVTDVGDCRLIVGDTGIAVPSNDVAALTAGLLQALDAEESLNLRARLRILENFTVGHLADRTEQALKGAISAPRRGPALEPTTIR
jgi:glycosyltransferase involved in cell wall biosynthesis